MDNLNIIISSGSHAIIIIYIMVSSGIHRVLKTDGSYRTLHNVACYLSGDASFNNGYLVSISVCFTHVIIFFLFRPANRRRKRTNTQDSSKENKPSTENNDSHTG